MARFISAVSALAVVLAVGHAGPEETAAEQPMDATVPSPPPSTAPTPTPAPRRTLPAGRVFDVAFPRHVTLGVLLDTELRVVGFRSPQEALELQAALSKLQARPADPHPHPAAQTHSSAASTTQPAALAGGTDSTSPPSPPPAFPFSLAEYSGLVSVGDLLIAVDNAPVWTRSPAEVAALVRGDKTQEVGEEGSDGGHHQGSTRVMTFLRPDKHQPPPPHEGGASGSPPGAGTGEVVHPDAPYRSYVRALAAKLARTARAAAASSTVSSSSSPPSAPAAQHYNVTVRIGEPVGALFTSDLVLIASDPMDTERFHAAAKAAFIAGAGPDGRDEGSADHTSGSGSGSASSLRLSSLPPSVAVSLVLRRGQLTGKAWPGDVLVAVDGTALPDLPKVGSRSAKEAQTHLLSALGIQPGAATAGRADDDALRREMDSGILALHARLVAGGGHSGAGNNTSPGSPSSRLSVDVISGASAGASGDVVCVAGGLYCVGTGEGVSAALALLQAAETARTNQARAGTEGGGVTAAPSPPSAGTSSSSSSSSPPPRTHVTLTFRRASHLPVELIPTSRHAAIAGALMRTANNASALAAQAGLGVIGITVGADGTSSSSSSSPLSTPAIDSRISCNGGRCSFRAADRVFLRVTGLDGNAVDSLASASAASRALSAVGAGGGPAGGAGSAAPAAGTDILVADELTLTSVPALFGGAFSCVRRPVVFASPSHGCSRLKWGQGSGGPPSYAGAIVVVERGTCTFPQKAAAVQAAGGSAMLVVNMDASPPVAMPGKASPAGGGGAGSAGRGGKLPGLAGEVDDSSIAIAAAMTDKQSGKRLREAVEAARAKGWTSAGAFSTHAEAGSDLCVAAAAAAATDKRRASGGSGGTAPGAAAGAQIHAPAPAAPAAAGEPGHLSRSEIGIDAHAFASALARFRKSGGGAQPPLAADAGAGTAAEDTDHAMIDLAGVESAFGAMAAGMMMGGGGGGGGAVDA
jgi:hypothetical protein